MDAKKTKVVAARPLLLGCLLTYGGKMSRYLRLSLCWAVVLSSLHALSASSGLLSSLPDSLSEAAELSVLTTGPSTGEIHAAFGHSGIRVQDTTQGLDIFFNYGVFDFRDSAFYLNYIKGELSYQMGIFDAKSYLAHTKREGRSLLSQRLALKPEEVRSIYRYLLYNYAPERRSFPYDYFYNNCATKIRDLFEEQLPGIRFGDAYVEKSPQAATFRELTNERVDYFPWLKLGINLISGSETDTSLSARSYMFLPRYVSEALRGAYLPSEEGTRLLVDQEKLLLADTQQRELPLNTPMFVFLAVLGLVFWITYRDHRRETSSHGLDVLLLICSGLMGLLMWWLWVGTRHHSAANYHLLWACPTHLLVLLVVYLPRGSAWLLLYLKIYGLVLGGLLLAWNLLPQQMPVEMIPLWLALLMRVVHHLQLNKRRIRASSAQVDGTSC